MKRIATALVLIPLVVWLILWAPMWAFVAALVAPIKDLRSWAFIFCFLSIGLTTRFRDLASAGRRPFIAFTAGVVVNVVLGFLLSSVVFAGYWTQLHP